MTTSPAPEEDSPPRHSGYDGVGSRRESRERALALLYEAEAKTLSPAEVIAALPVQPEAFADVLVTGVGEHGDEIDELLRRYARNWDLERMPAVDRALLRIGVFELAHLPDVPTGAVISEAVELAKRYSTDHSGKFVNGMLSRIAEEVRPGAAKRPERPEPTDRSTRPGPASEGTEVTDVGDADPDPAGDIAGPDPASAGEPADAVEPSGPSGPSRSSAG